MNLDLLGDARLASHRLTPIEEHDGLLVKRDDAFEFAGVWGGKVRTCLAIVAKGRVKPGIVTAGARHSPQVSIVARIAHALGVPARCHVPAGAPGPELLDAREHEAELIEHVPGRNTVIRARARDDARLRGWCHVPFGMECDEAVRQTAAQVVNVPEGVRRIVVPVGGGMTLAGVLTGLTLWPGARPAVLGVQVGADPTRRLDLYAPLGWRDRVKLVSALVPYGAKATGRLGALALDPIYEAKCVPFLEPGDLLWVVGRRHGVAA